VRVQATHSLCSGCRICQLACSLSQFGENNPKKTAIVISSRLLDDGHYRIAVCDQCGICAEVCPEGAIQKVDGHFEIESANCTSCLLCVSECPQQALVVAPGESTPVKCVTCGDCVELCPTGALALAQ
jgi:Fe-S-cluster-containing hydrogenase component 2